MIFFAGFHGFLLKYRELLSAGAWRALFLTNISVENFFSGKEDSTTLVKIEAPVSVLWAPHYSLENQNQFF